MADIDIDAATRFMTQHARLLDRRRFDLLCGTGDADSVRGALEGYRNPDGGYGWGIEPDARSPESQPVAFDLSPEAFDELCQLLEPAERQEVRNVGNGEVVSQEDRILRRP